MPIDAFFSSGMGDLRIYPEFRIFFFYFHGKKPEPGKLTIFYRGKNGGMIDTTADLPLIPI